jgi:flagellar M-ring protein FliF
LPKGGQKGWGLFEDSKIGESPLAQDVKHLQALQEELAMTIQMIDGVQNARVHLVLPERTLFSTSPSDAKASVTVNMTGARLLTSANIAAITHLVSGSIEGLSPNNVKIIDNTGRLLSGLDENSSAAGAGTYLDYKEKVQKMMEKKVKDMLNMVLGADRCTITICAEIDMTSTEIQETSVLGKAIPLEEETTATKKTIASKSEEQSLPSNEEKDEQSKIKYFLPQKITKKSEVPGRITSLSVSAMVDLTAPATEENQAPAQIMTIDQVKEIIRNAVGRDILSDESLTVVNVPFAKIETIQTEKTAGFGMGEIINIVKQGSLGIMAVCALLIFKIFTGSKPKASVEASSPEMQLAAGGGTTALALPSDPQAIRKQISNALKSNPQQVKQLFSAWIQES